MPTIYQSKKMTAQDDATRYAIAASLDFLQARSVTQTAVAEHLGVRPSAITQLRGGVHGMAAKHGWPFFRLIVDTAKAHPLTLGEVKHLHDVIQAWHSALAQKAQVLVAQLNILSKEGTDLQTKKNPSKADLRRLNQLASQYTNASKSLRQYTGLMEAWQAAAGDLAAVIEEARRKVTL